MDRPLLAVCYLFTVVDCFTDNVEDTSEHFFTDRYFDRCAGSNSFHTANKAFTHVHRDRTDTSVTEVSGNFKNQTVLGTFYVPLNFDCFIDCWKFSLKININNRTNYLGNFTYHHFLQLFHRLDAADNFD